MTLKAITYFRPIGNVACNCSHNASVLHARTTHCLGSSSSKLQGGST
jgi:hypothetical protein